MQSTVLQNKLSAVPPVLALQNPQDLSWLLNVQNDVGDLEEARNVLGQAARLIRDQEERIRQLEGLAMTDELTGLTNRRGFIQGLRRELAAARRDATAQGIVVMIDLDGFKKINDLHGHAAGDHYLEAVAVTLINSVRASDLVARLGGDEFAILMPRLSELAGMARIAQIETAFNEATVPWKRHSLKLCASFGLSIYSGNEGAEGVIADADLKLYAHKARRQAERDKMAVKV